MKPVAFEYARPATVAEACALLAEDGNSRILAGGQTLIPMLAMRLARPSCLVDIARIPELGCIRDAGTFVVVGAATRQVVAERDPLVARKVEHITMMVAAVVFAHLGRVLGRKAPTPAAKRTRMMICFGIATLLMIAGTPWPGMRAGRPLFRL